MKTGTVLDQAMLVSARYDANIVTNQDPSRSKGPRRIGRM